MERITKQELKAIRKALGMNRYEFADFIQVSESHIAKSEGKDTTPSAYGISRNLDTKIREKLESINISLDEVIKIAKKEGWL